MMRRAFAVLALVLVASVAFAQGLKPIGGGGGGGSGGAPTNAQYWVGAPNGSLSAEIDLSALGTGLVLNTAGTPSQYAGFSCTNQFPRSANSSGTVTCSSTQFSEIAAATNTNALMVGAGGRLEPTSTGVVHANELAGRGVSGFTGPSGLLPTVQQSPIANRIPKFNTALNLADSLVSDDGTTVQVNGAGVGQWGLADLAGVFGTFQAPNAYGQARTWQLPDATGMVVTMAAQAGVADGTILIGNQTNKNFAATALGVAGQLTVATNPGGLLVRYTQPIICDIVVGSEGGLALTTVQLAPQIRRCTVISTGVIVEVRLESDSGAPRVMFQKRTTGPGAVNTNLLTNGLTGGANATCARTATGVSFDTRSTCGNTLTVVALSPGDVIGFATAMSAASGGEKMVKGTVLYTITPPSPF